jgi:hypothetical protein
VGKGEAGVGCPSVSSAIVFPTLCRTPMQLDQEIALRVLSAVRGCLVALPVAT